MAKRTSLNPILIVLCINRREACINECGTCINRFIDFFLQSNDAIDFRTFESVSCRWWFVYKQTKQMKTQKYVFKMDVAFYKENRKNKNTEHATDSWMRHYTSWASENDVIDPLESFDAVSLNEILERYFAGARKRNGEEYEPTSLCSLQAAVDRYLRKKGSTFSILKDREFAGSRDVLDGKGKYLRQELGKGKHPNRAQSLSPDEEEYLWQAGQLGTHTPRALSNSMWYLLSLHFGLKESKHIGY